MMTRLDYQLLDERRLSAEEIVDLWEFERKLMTPLWVLAARSFWRFILSL
jgi:predicted lipid-binding transport protein (Tim44 family)